MPKLITFEGINGCGKTTIIDNLIPILNDKYKIYRSYEPGNMFGHFAKFGCPGLGIDSSLYLWWLARQFEQNKPEYQSADIVIKDRYYDSTYVYQQLDDHSNLFNINYNPLYFNKPDLTFIFDIVDVDIILERQNNRIKDKDQFNIEDVEKLINRNCKYLEVIDLFPNRNIKPIYIDGKSVNNIVEMCSREIFNLVGEKNDS